MTNRYVVTVACFGPGGFTEQREHTVDAADPDEARALVRSIMGGQLHSNGRVKLVGKTPPVEVPEFIACRVCDGGGCTACRGLGKIETAEDWCRDCGGPGCPDCEGTGEYRPKVVLTPRPPPAEP